MCTGFFLSSLGYTLEEDNWSNQESTPWGGQLAFYQKGHTPEAVTKSPSVTHISNEQETVPLISILNFRNGFS